jgi:hypothetical protein
MYQSANLLYYQQQAALVPIAGQHQEEILLLEAVLPLAQRIPQPGQKGLRCQAARGVPPVL